MSLLPEKMTTTMADYPGRLLIYGQSKVGKTYAIAQLPDTLFIDMESGTNHISGLYVIDVQSQLKLGFETGMDVLRSIYKELMTSTHRFKRVVFDTVDWLEVFCAEEVALANGVKHYTDLAYGKGYQEVRDKAIQLLDAFYKLGLEVIVVGHRKKSIIGEEGSEVHVKDLDLTGKFKNFLFGWADAIGYMHRLSSQNGNITTALSFKTDQLESLEGGCRINRLQGKTIPLIEMNQHGEVVQNNWSEIYPQLKSYRQVA